MAYTEKKDGIFDSTAEVALTSTGVVKKFSVARPIIVRQVSMCLTTAITSSGSVVVALKQYPVANSASNEVLLGALTIPTGAAAGTVYYKDLAAVYKIVPGQELVFEVTTAASSAGKATPMFVSDDSPETAANDANMVKSA